MEDKNKLSIDLWIIGIVSFLALGGVVFALQNGMNDFSKNQSIPIALRVLTVGLCCQFAIAGLGISIVSVGRYRRIFFSARGFFICGAPLTMAN